MGRLTKRTVAAVGAVAAGAFVYVSVVEHHPHVEATVYNYPSMDLTRMETTSTGQTTVDSPDLVSYLRVLR